MPPRMTGAQRRAKQSQIRTDRNTPSMATWREDPAENRKLQLESGVPKSKLLNPKLKKTGGNKNSSPPSVLRYPNKRLENSTDYLEIKVIKYIPNSSFNKKVGGALGKEGKSGGTSGGEKTTAMGWVKKGVQMETATSRIRTAKPLSYVYLPIPENIGDTKNTGWDTSTMSPLQALKTQLALTAMTDPGKILQGIKNTKGFGEIDDTTRQAILSKLAGEASGVGGDALMARATGQVMNPNMEVLFAGPSIRDFTFDFVLAPRSMSEAQQVKQIIRTFKQHMAPKGTSGNGFFIGSPDVFMLQYKKGANPHPFLNVFKPMAMTSMNMSYTESNTYSTYHDGTPTVMKMTLGFRELNPIYFEDYDKEEGTSGVGY
tara:strand:+ start:867 stop:1985 length:1119 start_codon:yes stop_codon:yes gene_type:complete